MLGKPITDILLTGLVCIENGVAEFLPDYRAIHFEINNKFIIFESIEQYSKLKISIAENLLYYEVDDEDMLKSYTSISNIILLDIHDTGNKIESIYLYNKTLNDENFIICEAAKLILQNGQTIFLDPKYYFGINIGGNNQEKRWFENLNKEKANDIKVIVLN